MNIHEEGEAWLDHFAAGDDARQTFLKLAPPEAKEVDSLMRKVSQLINIHSRIKIIEKSIALRSAKQSPWWNLLARRNSSILASEDSRRLALYMSAYETRKNEVDCIMLALQQRPHLMQLCFVVSSVLDSLS